MEQDPTCNLCGEPTPDFVAVNTLADNLYFCHECFKVVRKIFEAFGIALIETSGKTENFYDAMKELSPDEFQQLADGIADDMINTELDTLCGTCYDGTMCGPNCPKFGSLPQCADWEDIA